MTNVVTICNNISNYFENGRAAPVFLLLGLPLTRDSHQHPTAGADLVEVTGRIPRKFEVAPSAPNRFP